MLQILWGLGGIAVLIGLALLLSSNKKAVLWRTIFVGLAIQTGFAFLVLKSEIGRKALQGLSNGVTKLMGYTNEGINFLFGGLFQAKGIGFVFALQVLPTIIFFSALIAGLYHLGIMQKVIGLIGGGLSKLLGTSQTESMSAAANIFVGQTEAPLIVKPYISKMTQSELFAVMVGGLASVAGSTLVGYALLGIPIEYLLAASFMSAPAGLIMAKLIVPETEKRSKDEKVVMEKMDSANIFDAIAGGASDGLKLAVNVGAMLLAFIAIITMLNAAVGGIGNLVGLESLSIEMILGYIFAPLAFIIGVPMDEAVRAASFIGQKLVLNEFVAFMNLGPVIGDLSPKTAIITSFALTGFANFGCIGILLGGIGGMAPNRRKDIARLGVKAVLAATLANMLSAAIAGMML
jgi:concentrative nucleoside transporter, CNT family